MHQHAAQGQHVGLPGLVAPGVDGLGEADFARLRAAVDEFGRVLQDKDRTFARRNARRGRGEVAGENAVFSHPRIVKEAVGRLRRRLVAAGRRDWLDRRSCQLIKQPLQPADQALVGKGRRAKLFLPRGFAAAGLVSHP